jgi:hypothetical protein
MKKFIISKLNVALSFFWLIAITFSIVGILFAATPNPGHDFSAIGGGTVQGDLLYGSAADTISALAKNTSATRYLSNTGASNNPAWAQVDMTNGVTGILPTANGGTASAFFTVSGLSSSAKTFTFPNASATVLTSNAAVTVAQGGTGAAPGADDQVLVADSTSAATWKTINDCQGTGKALTYTQSSNTIGCNTISGGGTNALLDGSSHTDTAAGTVVRGDVIVGNSTPAWSRLAKGTANQVLSMNSGATDVAWADRMGYTLSVQALTSSPADAATVYFGQMPKAPITTANVSKVYIPKTGTITRAQIYVYSGTAGTAENWSLYVRLNNATDTLIETLGAAASERIFNNESLSIAVTAGDYIEIKGIQPTWATNPATTIYGGYLWIQ